MQHRPVFFFALVLALAAGCTDAPDADGEAPDTLTTATPEPNTPLGVDGEYEVSEPSAVLNPTAGNSVNGQVVFTPLARGVRVLAQVNGLPEGTHGFHIHETGDCSASDASSAGGHYNPTGAPHGAPDAAERHVGDLGNIVANADSTGGYDQVDSVISLDGPDSIVGKAVVIHAGEDDFTSQPSGDAGNRLACGVIEANED